ncbi:hypothetical protein D3C79_737130 [compost metagenome]
MWQIPDSTRWAKASARLVSRLKMADDKPNSESLASVSKASSPSARSTTATGPKDSSWYRRMLASTLSNRVGCKMLPSSWPPHTRRAPLATASSISALMRSPAAPLTSEPSTDVLACGSPARSPPTLAASLSTKVSAMQLSTTRRSVDMQIWPWLK